MAGQLTIDTLKASSGVLATQNGMTGIAKAWVNFNGTTASPSTIRSSFNVTSVTKNGTGDYTVNFTTAMPDSNYALTGSVGIGAQSGGSGIQIEVYTGVGQTTTSSRFVTSRQYSPYTPFDSLWVSAAFYSA